VSSQKARPVKGQVITALREVKERVRQARELVMAEAPCCQVLHETVAAQKLLADLQAALLYDRLLHCLSYIEGAEPRSAESNRHAILKLFAVTGKLPVRIEEVEGLLQS